MLKTTCAILLPLMLLCPACDDESAASEPSDETTETAEGPGTDEGAAGSGAPADEPVEVAEPTPCPDETAMVVHGTDRNAGLAGVAGPIEGGTTFGDVTLGASVTLLFASYVIEADPQFGLSAPVGDPNAPENGLIFQARLDATDLPLGAYNAEGEGDGVVGRMTFHSLYNGSSRIIPLGTHTVTLTEVTDEHICGEITAVGETSMQRFPSVTGRFRVDAI